MPNEIISEEKEGYRQTNGVYRYSKVMEPTIEVYLPAGKNANVKAVLISPGGAYGHLAYDWEGTDIDKFLNGKDVAGIAVDTVCHWINHKQISIWCPL